MLANFPFLTSASQSMFFIISRLDSFYTSKFTIVFQSSQKFRGKLVGSFDEKKSIKAEFFVPALLLTPD